MLPRYFSLKPFLIWQHLERPVCWEACFGRPGPLEVEIGFGGGEYLVKQARERPQINFIGIELEWAAVQKALRKIALAGVKNVRLLMMDARVAFERLFQPQSLQQTWALFPDPWPKNRHVKHRLFTESFFKLLNSRLAPDGRAQIVTDNQILARWAAQQAGGSGLRCECRDIPPRFGTRYEETWRLAGQERFFELLLNVETPARVPLVEDIPMRNHRIDVFNPDGFQPRGDIGDITVEFKDFYFDPVRKTAMLRAIVVEESLMQNFWIQILSQGDSWTIRAAKGCAVVPTAGAQKALDLVKEAAGREAGC